MEARDPEREAAELRRLRWRCRRGMRELDQLMLRYLDARWPSASDEERAVFLQLLDTEGAVEFDAHYVEGNRRAVLHERSLFLREQGRWVYVGPVAAHIR